MNRIKAAVRERDGMRCTACGLSNEQHIERRGRALEVHRLVPGSLYDIEGCVTLCKGCHSSKPKRPKGTIDLATQKRMVGIPERLAVALEKVAERRVQTLTEVVKTACVEYLTGLGLWPPKEK